VNISTLNFDGRKSWFFFQLDLKMIHIAMLKVVFINYPHGLLIFFVWIVSFAQINSLFFKVSFKLDISLIEPLQNESRRTCNMNWLLVLERNKLSFESSCDNLKHYFLRNCVNIQPLWITINNCLSKLNILINFVQLLNIEFPHFCFHIKTWAKKLIVVLRSRKYVKVQNWRQTSLKFCFLRSESNLI